MLEAVGAEVLYDAEPDLPVAEFRRVLEESGLGRMRPLNDPGRLERMLAAAQLVLTARRGRGGPLLGVARAISDGAWCAYLPELAVCPAAQGMGVGRGLLREARRRLGPEVGLFLASVPEAAGFYEREGMIPVPHGFRFGRER